MNKAHNRIEDPQEFINTLESPTLLMQAEPRQVVTANKKACELFAKDLLQIKGRRGGQVFDCVYSFTELGCGLDPNCERCRIKAAVMDTFATGNSHANVHTVLDIKKQNATFAYALEVSTMKVDGFVLLFVSEFAKTGT